MRIFVLFTFTTARYHYCGGNVGSGCSGASFETMLDGVLRGFSGDDENVKISITYEGVTYSRANTTLGNLALGGRTSVSLQGNEVEMTFEVVGIKKYGDASLSGYYKGAVTVIE